MYSGKSEICNSNYPFPLGDFPGEPVLYGALLSRSKNLQKMTFHTNVVKYITTSDKAWCNSKHLPFPFGRLSVGDSFSRGCSATTVQEQTENDVIKMWSNALP